VDWNRFEARLDIQVRGTKQGGVYVMVWKIRRLLRRSESAGSLAVAASGLTSGLSRHCPLTDRSTLAVNAGENRTGSDGGEAPSVESVATFSETQVLKFFNSKRNILNPVASLRKGGSCFHIGDERVATLPLRRVDTAPRMIPVRSRRLDERWCRRRESPAIFDHDVGHEAARATRFHGLTPPGLPTRAGGCLVGRRSHSLSGDFATGTRRRRAGPRSRMVIMGPVETLRR